MLNVHRVQMSAMSQGLRKQQRERVRQWQLAPTSMLGINKEWLDWCKQKLTCPSNGGSHVAMWE